MRPVGDMSSSEHAALLCSWGWLCCFSILLLLMSPSAGVLYIIQMNVQLVLTLHPGPCLEGASGKDSINDSHF